MSPKSLHGFYLIMSLLFNPFFNLFWWDRFFSEEDTEWNCLGKKRDSIFSNKTSAPKVLGSSSVFTARRPGSLESFSGTGLPRWRPQNQESENAHITEVSWSGETSRRQFLTIFAAGSDNKEFKAGRLSRAKIVIGHK